MLLRPLIVTSLGSFALAGGVGNVSHSPIVVHADLQAAVDAAADGDVLVVHGGTYSGFTVDNRSLAIFAVPGETVIVQGTVALENVPASKRVVLSELTLRETLTASIDGDVALRIENCTGGIWIQSTQIEGANGFDANMQDGGAGGAAASVANASSVVFVNCALIGGRGGNTLATFCCFLPGCCWSAGDGGPGLFASGATRIAAYACSFVGGKGGAFGDFAGAGAHGIELSAPAASFLSGSSALGGDGGDCNAYQAGDGGDGLRASATATLATVLDCGFAGGAAGAAGTPSTYPGTAGVGISGTTTQLAPNARTFAIPHVARDATLVQASLGGDDGDAFFVPSSSTSAWILKLAANGVWTLRYPSVMSTTPIAVLGASGTATANWTTPPVPNGAQVTLRFAQGYALPSSGGAVLASPACTLALDVATLPDCDGNGVFDVIDVVEGAPDVNFNFKPDLCETQPVWYVDDSAAPGGDGSLSAPYPTLGEGVAAALPGRIVEVFDGTYTGALNRELDFGGKALTVRSQNGAASCVIDCQDLGRAFHLHSGEALGTRIEGFTVRDGRRLGANSAYGGAILIEDGANASVSGCSFESNFAETAGGALAIRADAGIVDVRDCWFTENATAWNGGDGGGALLCESSATVAQCTFVSGRSDSGGAIRASGDLTLDVSHSTFLANESRQVGGALYVSANAAGELARVRASNLLFAGNTTEALGGAIRAVAFTSSASVVLDCAHSTFTANSTTVNSTGTGGGALSIGDCTATLLDCIFWQNSSATVGSQIRLGASSTLNVDYCDVDSGSAGVFAGTGTLNWGAGNLALDPLFVDADGPDDDPLTFGDNVYRVFLASPCLDAGDALHALADWTDIDDDLDFGEPVPLDLNSKPRFTDLTSVPDTGLGSPPLDLGCYERQN